MFPVAHALSTRTHITRRRRPRRGTTSRAYAQVIDDCDEVTDRAVAEHIVDVHRGERRALEAPFTIDELRAYVRVAKKIFPRISDAAAKTLVKCYRLLPVCFPREECVSSTRVEGRPAAHPVDETQASCARTTSWAATRRPTA